MLVLMLALVVFAPVALATDDQVGATAPQQLLWALMSIAVPFVTGLMVRKSYPKWLKALVAFILAAGVGVGTVYATGGWSGDAWVIVLACFGVAQVTFLGVIETFGIKDWLYGQVNADLSV
jgi:peptidoglycan/LPS O-acetylase OafA/YrhL